MVSLTKEESFALNKVMLADSIVFMPPSTTVPCIVPFTCCAKDDKETIERTNIRSGIIFFMSTFLSLIVLVNKDYRTKIGTMHNIVVGYRINGTILR